MVKNFIKAIFRKRSLALSLLAALSALNPAAIQKANAGAPPIADSPCDSNYYESLSSRAWLEAQREITQNQNLILKPDSVFEYTCFDLFLRELAQHARNMFSETTSFGGPLPANSMDNALQQLVGTSLINFVNANFGYYDMLGGHTAGQGISHVPQPIVGGTYTCDMMNQVWLAAKCINFASDPAEDGFYTFEEYRTDPDKRHLPNRCPAMPGIWAANINASIVNPLWTPDPMKTYLAFIDPANCVGGNANNIAIPTGVDVKGTAGGYAEHVCIIPGCRYNPGPGSCQP